MYKIIAMSVFLIGCQTDSGFINFPVTAESNSDSRPASIEKERIGDCTATVKRLGKNPEIECEKY
jgi:hypothetical protein